FSYRVASKSRELTHVPDKKWEMEVSSFATPADKLIGTAHAVIEKSPSDFRGFNLLAAALMQKSRETGDFALNNKAETALTQSFSLSSDNYEALKLRAKLLLTFHRFPEALEAAKGVQALRPDDHDVYGALTDALVEMGDYQPAVAAAQKMVDLRPDTASYARVSYLRYLHGDTEGAVTAMRAAVEAANPQDLESMAWCRVQLGRELINVGHLNEAEHEIDHALFLFPGFHAALAAKAYVRYLAHDSNQAVDYYERAYERVPLPDYSVALGDLYSKLGRQDEAKKQYDLVDFIERSGAIQGTYSRQLALFWANHDQRLDEALAIATNERRTRGDIYTADVLAWCLYKKGRLDEAKASIDEALHLGTHDPLLLYHAGMIGNARGDRRGARNYLKQALALNSDFDILQADIARQTLAKIK
ncbi:MAG TPA: tetratricopeptide repeat protein, partial [Pyrinomonadaceae bacterium]